MLEIPAMPPGPVAVGGVGGSGTRVVAEMLSRLGFYLGRDLNSASDNQTFTLLFKRPEWLQRHTAVGDETAVFEAIEIFHRAMAGALGPNRSELGCVLGAAFDMLRIGHDHPRSRRGSWAARQLRRLVWPVARTAKLLGRGAVGLNGYVGWGWKEPNTHVFLGYLARYFPAMKYVHVIRHGLDMAYSGNQAQLNNWGPYFGITPPPSPHEMPRASLDFWIAANERAVSLGRQLLEERFLVLNFDRLCLDPEPEIRALTEFLGVEVEPSDFAELTRMPKAPRSMGRYREKGLGAFEDRQIEAVVRLGFEVSV